MVNSGAQTRQANATSRDWIAVTAGAIGAMMATLDISISNAALPQIQGSIGANGTEGTWISTGYLMSEIVIIPLTAWLTRVFGLRRFLLWNAALFTLFSVICGVSQTLPMMVIGRVGQGLAGGAMIPTAQMLVRTRLPAHQMPIGMTIFGLIVILGPVFGPGTGGWLTETLSWHWCFFVNLPICIGLIALLYIGLPREPLNWQAFIRADWLGITGLTLGLSTLTVVLEDGQREHWFDSPFIVWLSLASAAGLSMLMAAQFRSRQPVIKLKLLLNKNYASVIFIVFTIGAGTVGMAYLLPQFLSGVAGYNAQQSGSVLMMSGVPALLLMPILPHLLEKVSSKWLVTVGLLAFGASCVLNVGLTPLTGGNDFLWSQLLLGVGQIMALMPLNQASMAAVSSEDAADAAGLYNMSRNLGGSIGLALLGVFIDQRNVSHLTHIRESVTANSEIGQAHILGSAGSFISEHADAAYASLQAYRQLLQQMQGQATVLTYADAFFVLGFAALACIPLTLLLKRPQQVDMFAGH